MATALIGTEKQIAWATKLRAGVAAAAREMLSPANLAGTCAVVDNLIPTLVAVSAKTGKGQPMIDAIVAEVESNPSAAHWIDTRGESVHGLIAAAAKRVAAR